MDFVNFDGFQPLLDIIIDIIIIFNQKKIKNRSNFDIINQKLGKIDQKVTSSVDQNTIFIVRCITNLDFNLNSDFNYIDDYIIQKSVQFFYYNQHLFISKSDKIGQLMFNNRHFYEN